MDGDASNIKQLGYPSFAPPGLAQPAVRTRIFGKTATSLGAVATRTSLRVKKFVAAHEVAMPQAREVVAGLKHIIPGISHETRKQHAEAALQAEQEENSYAERDSKLKKIVSESNEVLAKATTVFPFTLFRDDLVVDRTKVTITKRNFFFSSEVMSIRIEDILNVKTATGPFFGSLVLVVRVLSSEDHHSINYFWREDAIRLKHIIQGYVIAQHNQIDTAHLSKDELISTLAELGHDSNS